MIRRSFVYVLFCCLFIGSAWAFAQHSPAPKNNDKEDKEDRCNGYKMRVITPSNNIDYKMQIIKPSEDIDRRMVVAPCKMPKIELMPLPSSPEKEKQK